MVEILPYFMKLELSLFARGSANKTNPEPDESGPYDNTLILN